MCVSKNAIQGFDKNSLSDENYKVIKRKNNRKDKNSV